MADPHDYRYPTKDSKSDSTISSRRGQPSMTIVLTHLQQELWPFTPAPAGPPHPKFPRTLMQWHLLTEPEVDSLAAYHHQRPLTPRSIAVVVSSDIAAHAKGHESTNPWSACVSRENYPWAATEYLMLRLRNNACHPSIWTDSYPARIEWCEGFFEYIGRRYGRPTRIAMKKRKLSKFIGLRVSPTPTWESQEWGKWKSEFDNLSSTGC